MSAWIKPLLKLNKQKRGKIKGSYNFIVSKLGPPNLNQIDDTVGVTASWGFQDDQMREAWVWGFHATDENETYWSCGGDPFVLQKVFTHAFEGSVSGWA